jgi:hypothetical protein
MLRCGSSSPMAKLTKDKKSNYILHKIYIIIKITEMQLRWYISRFKISLSKFAGKGSIRLIPQNCFRHFLKCVINRYCCVKLYFRSVSKSVFMLSFLNLILLTGLGMQHILLKAAIMPMEKI